MALEPCAPRRRHCRRCDAQSLLGYAPSPPAQKILLQLRGLGFRQRSPRLRSVAVRLRTRAGTAGRSSEFRRGRRSAPQGPFRDRRPGSVTSALVGGASRAHGRIVGCAPVIASKAKRPQTRGPSRGLSLGCFALLAVTVGPADSPGRKSSAAAARCCRGGQSNSPVAGAVR
jgi:hypothetical protein